MKRFMTIAIATFVTFTIVAATVAAPAYAGKRERRIAAGIIFGAIGGAIIAGHANRHKKYKRYGHYRDRHYVYDEPHYVAPRRYKRARHSRRSTAWERHVERCYDRYRTYDHRSDTFIGYDGYEHQCRL